MFKCVTENLLTERDIHTTNSSYSLQYTRGQNAAIYHNWLFPRKIFGSYSARVLPIQHYYFNPTFVRTAKTCPVVMHARKIRRTPVSKMFYGNADSTAARNDYTENRCKTGYLWGGGEIMRNDAIHGGVGHG